MNALENRERPGFVNHAMYEILMDAVSGLPGIFAEFGIHKAATFDSIYRQAMKDGRAVLAFDTFVGMPEPKHPGDERFPKGTFDTGGSRWFTEKYPEAMIIEGVIPEVFEWPIFTIPQYNDFVFSHVDLDHQESTLQTLEWVWPRTEPGGIVVCHDYNDRDQTCAPKAIRDWMNRERLHHIGYCDHSIWFRKGYSES